MNYTGKQTPQTSSKEPNTLQHTPDTAVYEYQAKQTPNSAKKS